MTSSRLRKSSNPFLRSLPNDLDCTNADVVEAGLGVASGKMTYEELLDWTRDYRA